MARNLVTLVALAGVFALLAACSSGASTPAPSRPTPSVVNYGPSTGGAGGTTANLAGPYRWYTNMSQAQAAARAEQKLILCVSTKPGCGLCDKFKNQIVPATAQRCGQMSVGYIYDIRHPETPLVDKTLRANLKGAALMPLVGFLTPEMGWVHGFWGPRNTSEFLGDIATAQRIYPVASNRRIGATMPEGPRMASVINEFGEREYGMPGDVWPTDDPEPIDAITGRPSPDAPAPRPEDLMPEADTLLADTTPAPESDALRPDGLVAPRPAALGSPDAVVDAAPVVADGLAYTGPGVPPPPSSLPPLREPGPAPAASTPEWSGPTPSTTASKPRPVASGPRPVPSEALESWARQALRDALAKIRSGEYDAAKYTLRAVKSKLPDTDLAREAARGTVAIYNYKKVRGAHDKNERSKWLERAKRDLGASMWGELFSA